MNTPPSLITVHAHGAAAQALVPLFLSCTVGVCMSHSAYLLRDAVSATLFTIVGILCKVGACLPAGRPALLPGSGST